MEINTISVIGSGTMGNGIAHVCGLNGFNTFLVDIDMDLFDNAVNNIELNLSKQLCKGLISKKQKSSCLNNITTTMSINDIIDSDLVIEAIPENQKIKESLKTRLPPSKTKESYLEERERKTPASFEEDLNKTASKYSWFPHNTHWHRSKHIF